MWPFKSRSNTALLAERLYRTCVVGDTNDTALRLTGLHINLSDDQKQSFLSKYALYCEAAVLRVILTEKAGKHSSEHADDLLREFEKLIFGSKPSASAAKKLVAIKSAMRTLDELFTQKREVSWCRNWLLDIGYDETNFATLIGFALFVENVTKQLRELVPKLLTE